MAAAVSAPDSAGFASAYLDAPVAGEKLAKPGENESFYSQSEARSSRPSISASDRVSAGPQTLGNPLYSAAYLPGCRPEVVAAAGEAHSSEEAKTDLQNVSVTAFEMADKLATNIYELPHQLREGANVIQERTHSTALQIVHRFGVEALVLVAYSFLGIATMIGVTFAVHSKGYFKGIPHGFLSWNSFVAKSIVTGILYGVFSRFLRHSFSYWDKRIEAHYEAGSSPEVIDNMRQIFSFLLSLGGFEACTCLFIVQLFGSFSFCAFLFVVPVATLLRTVARALLLDYVRNEGVSLATLSALYTRQRLLGEAGEAAEPQTHADGRQSGFLTKAALCMLEGPLSFFGPCELYDEDRASLDVGASSLHSSLLAPNNEADSHSSSRVAGVATSLRQISFRVSQAACHTVDGFLTFELCAVLSLLMFQFSLARFFLQNALVFAVACVLASRAAELIDCFLPSWGACQVGRRTSRNFLEEEREADALEQGTRHACSAGTQENVKSGEGSLSFSPATTKTAGVDEEREASFSSYYQIPAGEGARAERAHGENDAHSRDRFFYRETDEADRDSAFDELRSEEDSEPRKAGRQQMVDEAETGVASSWLNMILAAAKPTGEEEGDEEEDGEEDGDAEED
ncbi:hypothetical protein TGARI_222400 [Toxoplasma gondii ARI]|uniref:Transmembrane protein n=1 Tax=Toxoplasma gondii ARI TaxID=1074872 RepID=A0A139XUU5_TOXGO|nr:hypothetical protein TGARI_222400 [Toxoplasma gondii ARI]